MILTLELEALLGEYLIETNGEGEDVPDLEIIAEALGEDR
jgi:hypothetical protein